MKTIKREELIANGFQWVDQYADNAEFYIKDILENTGLEHAIDAYSIIKDNDLIGLAHDICEFVLPIYEKNMCTRIGMAHDLRNVLVDLKSDKSEYAGISSTCTKMTNLASGQVLDCFHLLTFTLPTPDIKAICFSALCAYCAEHSPEVGYYFELYQRVRTAIYDRGLAEIENIFRAYI